MMNKPKPVKKVTFHDYVEEVPSEIILTEEDKRRIWYNSEEYDGFKFGAASNAGVRLFDFFPAVQQPDKQGSNGQTSYPHKFVVLGSFDEQEDNSLATDASVARGFQPAAANRTKDTSYHVPIKCMNEYNDAISNDGTIICKRGLGYHFSRFRKRNRVWTRAMVLTWQKTLRSMSLDANGKQQPLKLSQKCDVKLHKKSQHLLAVVSSKCSRTARQAALWRGKMDYIVAYPENGKLSARVSTTDESVRGRASSEEEQSHNKRQRLEIRGGSLTFTYLAGVLAVEI
jgi:hypothetical protein